MQRDVGRGSIRKGRWHGEAMTSFRSSMRVRWRAGAFARYMRLHRSDAGSLAARLDDLVAQRQINHSTVAIQELMHTVGVLNPSTARTAAVIDEIGKQIKAMPPHRIFAPDIEVLGRAALLSGILCRLQGYEKDGKLRALQDCVLFLQAQKLGLVVLTANVSDYDILLQLIPAGRALFYRQK